TPRRVHRTDGDRERDACGEPAGDADAAERRRGALVPALPGRLRDELGRGGGGAQEGPEGERRDRQGGGRDGRLPRGQRGATVPYDFGVEAVRRRPTIGARERLRGPAAAPGAVRIALPARPAREVQGIGARARLDARAAGRLDARLPRRVRRPLEGPADRDRALLALPPVRPTSLGLLLDVPTGRRAEHRRERADHPQGALPAPARTALRRRDRGDRVRRDTRAPALTHA